MSPSPRGPAPADPFVAEIRLFGFGFPPAGWLECDGRLLDIDAHQPLFSVLGWRYGGDRHRTFALPALRGTTASPFVFCIAAQGLYPPRG